MKKTSFKISHYLQIWNNIQYNNCHTTTYPSHKNDRFWFSFCSLGPNSHGACRDIQHSYLCNDLSMLWHALACIAAKFFLHRAWPVNYTPSPYHPSPVLNVCFPSTASNMKLYRVSYPINHDQTGFYNNACQSLILIFKFISKKG